MSNALLALLNASGLVKAAPKAQDAKTPKAAPSNGKPQKDKKAPKVEKTVKKDKPGKNGKDKTPKAAPVKPVTSLAALEKSIKAAPSEGGATYASRADRGAKPGVSAFIIAKLRKASKDKPLAMDKLIDMVVGEFGPATEYNRRAEGLAITVRDYCYRNLTNRYQIELGGDSSGYWIKKEPKVK